jgi:nitroimidazol reductase NimA-like FMN-containing flavoprotein (pyridoxamine 5'-phosphate oxidase superfamily)
MDQAWAEELELDICLELLRAETVGRVGIVVDGQHPIVLPVNYRLVETFGFTWIALRTRPGNVIDTAAPEVALEIDGVDSVHGRGWSVLVRGMRADVDPDAAGFRERFDPHPWLTADREAWLVIEPFSITGRALHPAEDGWAYHHRAYL